MIDANLYDNDELIEIQADAIKSLKKGLSKKKLTDLANALECEYQLTLREGR